ncbi:MAG: calcium/sodium antiporter [Marinosulfonomonas sp.]|nr:calcium/sodium antiporter [Marinosulfonomonas sp.]
MDFLISILGLIILLLAGDVLVRGAVNASLRLGVPALIVSLTIVSIGTSTPELLIAVGSVVNGVPGLAVGNVIGSNTANVLLVLGLPAMMVGLNTKNCDTRQSYWQMLAATALFVVIAFLTPITWLHGLVLLGGFVAFIGHAVYRARSHQLASPQLKNTELEVEGADPKMSWWRISLYLILGLAGLPLGADLLVNSATEIARHFEISETVIGLTLVAVGTSLPELATTVAAALRRQADVALGNVIGSNIANILGILGMAAFFGNIPVSQSVLQFDLWVMVAASLVLIPFAVGRRNITRAWGAGFTALYAIYVVCVLT